ncbi:MAG: type III-B CRISPR-associated protein Cas10/Cmr2 [Thermoproteota archaeon]
MKKYLIKITIPSVQELILQSRKFIDMFISSSLIPKVLSETFKNYLNNEKVEFLIPSRKVIENNQENITNVSYIIYTAKDEEEVKEFCLSMEDKFFKILEKSLYDSLVKKIDIKGYEKLAYYQIRNSLRFLWGGVEIDKSLEDAKIKVDKLLAYLKGSFEPDISKIEGINLFDKENNIYYQEDFLKFLEDEENLNFNYTVGGLLCRVCGKRVILGAKSSNTKLDVKGEEFWKNVSQKHPNYASEAERMCGFCISKRVYAYETGVKIQSVVDFAIKEYPKEVEEELRKTIKNTKDIQDIYEENHKNLDKNTKQQLDFFFKLYGKPSPYYALLMADGDSMGEKVEKTFKENKVAEFTEKLSIFAEEFKSIIEKNRGRTIYTGGDDVLAIMPKSKGLNSFKEIFDKFKPVSTMSAGLIISHYKIPLRYVLKELREAESKAKSKGKAGIYIKYIKHSYSSAETFLKREDIEDFERLIYIMSEKDFPNTFITQLQQLLQPYLETVDNVDIVKALITYLIEKKNFNKKEEFLEILLSENLKDLNNLINKLKVAKFLATRGES